MHGDATANRAVVDCRLDRGLYAAAAHRRGRRPHTSRSAARVREQQMRMTMGRPEPTQDLPGLLRKRHRTVLVALATADVHAPTRGIDVTELQLQAFAQAKTQTVDREKIDSVTQLARGIDQLESLLDRQDIR